MLPGLSPRDLSLSRKCSECEWVRGKKFINRNLAFLVSLKIFKLIKVITIDYRPRLLLGNGSWRHDDDALFHHYQPATGFSSLPIRFRRRFETILFTLLYDCDGGFKFKERSINECLHLPDSHRWGLEATRVYALGVSQRDRMRYEWPFITKSSAWVETSFSS